MGEPEEIPPTETNEEGEDNSMRIAHVDDFPYDANDNPSNSLKFLTTY